MEVDDNRADRARDGIQHLQAAAHELIDAARALLDVAEDVVDDPAAIATLVGALGALGDAARARATRPPDDDGKAGQEPDAPIERITVA
ncbi:MAG TPA: hypothetical protein VKD21_03080 [Acidimicrobiales bacterium]|nr:hypothetical protein [Acidimicrobiales bacterium]